MCYVALIHIFGIDWATETVVRCGYLRWRASAPLNASVVCWSTTESGREFQDMVVLGIKENLY